MTEPELCPYPHIGTDEAGKGDYFGPLVVAGVFADDVALVRLPQAGVRDAKLVSQGTLRRLETAVKQICPAFEVVMISPARYNELHAKMRNLNRLLAWAHARAIENLLGRVDEADPGVAAASVLARAAFLRGLDRASAEAGVTLPRGATHVLPAAREVVAKGGEHLLRRVAKVHFKTTKAVMRQPGL